MGEHKAEHPHCERRNALFLKLREISPALFAAKSAPMKIGISGDIVDRLELDAEATRDLGKILSQHVNRYAYQKALTAEGAVRLGLDGTPAGLVTEEQRQMAAKKLERLKAKLKAKAAKARDGNS